MDLSFMESFFMVCSFKSYHKGLNGPVSLVRFPLNGSPGKQDSNLRISQDLIEILLSNFYDTDNDNQCVNNEKKIQLEGHPHHDMRSSITTDFSAMSSQPGAFICSVHESPRKKTVNLDSTPPEPLSSVTAGNYKSGSAPGKHEAVLNTPTGKCRPAAYAINPLFFSAGSTHLNN